MRKYFYKEMNELLEDKETGAEFASRISKKYGKHKFIFKLLYHATNRISTIKVNNELNLTNLIRLNLTTGVDFYYYFTGKSIPGDFKKISWKNKNNHEILLPIKLKKEFDNENVKIDIFSYFKASDWITFYRKGILTVTNNHFHIVVNDKISHRADYSFQIINHPLLFEVYGALGKKELIRKVGDSKLSFISDPKLNHVLYLKESKKYGTKKYKYDNLLKEMPEINNTESYLDYLDILDDDHEYTYNLAMSLID